MIALQAIQKNYIGIGITTTTTTTKLRIWSHLRKKSLMENFIFCAVQSLKDFPRNRFMLLKLQSWS